MSIITVPDTNQVDLNLLRVLLTVLEERNATRAARRLHVTQSAVSNSLARLRKVFCDPLVRRDGNGLAPTPLAASLMPALQQALAQVDHAVRSHIRFDPERTERRFNLACTDAHHFRDVPWLAQAFGRQLPKAELHIVSPDVMEFTDGLASGSIDAALMPRQAVPPGQPFEALYDEGFAFVVRRDHPSVGASLTVQQFNAQRHIDTLVVRGRGGIGHKLAGDLLGSLGLVRSIALAVPSFSAAGLAASRSDFVAGLPARLADILCELLPLRQIKVPIPRLTFPICLTWHVRADADPGARCFRKLVVDTLGPANAAKWRASKQRPKRRARPG